MIAAQSNLLQRGFAQPLLLGGRKGRERYICSLPPHLYVKNAPRWETRGAANGCLIYTKASQREMQWKDGGGLSASWRGVAGGRTLHVDFVREPGKFTCVLKRG